MSYIEVSPDLDKWQEFVTLARNEIFALDALTVYFDEAAPDLPTELMFVTPGGQSLSIYLSPDTIQDFRNEMYSNNEAYATANNHWKE